MHLPRIYKNLWLSDLRFRETFNPQDNHFDVIVEIVDLDSKKKSSKITGVKNHTIDLKDRNTSWQVLKSKINKFRIPKLCMK